MNLVVVAATSSSSSLPVKDKQQVMNDVTTDFKSNTVRTTNGRWTTKEKSRHNHCEYTDLHRERKPVHLARKSVTTQICIANASQFTSPEKDSSFIWKESSVSSNEHEVWVNSKKKGKLQKKGREFKKKKESCRRKGKRLQEKEERKGAAARV